MISYTDHRKDPQAWAKQLKISLEAVQLYLDCEVIDLHTDSFLWKRLRRYRLGDYHSLPAWRSRLGGQVDFPKCLEAQMAGLVWDIPANPFLPRALKYAAVRKQIASMIGDFKRYNDQFCQVVSYADYLKARSEGKIACWISIQGGQALDHNLRDLERIPEVHRITLVHLTRSRIGASNLNPLHKSIGISKFGAVFIEKMAAEKILVDLSHINRKGFFEALKHLPKGVPPIVTHTGVQALCPSFRNIDDAQIRAIAQRHGTIGIIYEKNFLAGIKTQQTTDQIVAHIEHVIKTVGEDHVSLGSDYDGLIGLPEDFKDITTQPRLVELMLRRGWSEKRIRKILAGNFLRVVQMVRPV